MRSPSSTSSSMTSGRQDPWTSRWPALKWTRETVLDSLNGARCETLDRSFLPKHAAVATWKHWPYPMWNKREFNRCPKDRGTEQGDVDGLPECTLAVGMVAAEARSCVATQEAARTLPWIDTDTHCTRSVYEMKRDRMQKIQNFQHGGPEKLIGADDPRHDMLCKKTEAWRTNGKKIMVTSSVSITGSALSTSLRRS